MRITEILALVSILILTSTACEEDGAPTSPERRRSVSQSQHTGDNTTLAVESRFAVTLDVRGLLKPGHPITVQMDVETLHDTQLARYTLHAPEVYGASTSEFGWNFRVPTETRIPSLVTERLSSARGARNVVHTTFTIPQPGYYRLAGGAFLEATKPNGRFNGAIVSQGNHETVWLWISETGGKVTESFDASLFPVGTLIAPGPLRFIPADEVPSSTGRSLRPASSVTVELLYWDEGAEDYFAIQNADWMITWTDYSDPYNPKERSAIGSSSNTGTFDPGCPDNYDSGYSGDFYSSSSYGTVVSDASSNTDIGSFFISQGDCYQPTTIQALATDDDKARLTTDIARAARNANSSFGYSRPSVTAVITDSTGYRGGSPEKIFIEDPFNTWTTSHEYGHAYERVALDGPFRDRLSGCQSHSYDGTSSYGCAVSEGFADFFAEVMGEVVLHDNEDGPTGVFSPAIEGSVAAFFHDLTDPANDDPISSVPYSYIGDIVRTCRVDGLKPSGIDHLIYCFEETISTATSAYFSGRTTPSSHTWSATSPGWNLSNLRDTWKWNLFGEEI